MVDTVDNLDADAKGDHSDKEEIVLPEKNSPWKVYLKPQWLTVLVS
jgi:hypothetical protein